MRYKLKNRKNWANELNAPMSTLGAEAPNPQAAVPAQSAMCTMCGRSGHVFDQCCHWIDVNGSVIPGHTQESAPVEAVAVGPVGPAEPAGPVKRRSLFSRLFQGSAPPDVHFVFVNIPAGRFTLQAGSVTRAVVNNVDLVFAGDALNFTATLLSWGRPHSTVALHHWTSGFFGWTHNLWVSTTGPCAVVVDPRDHARFTFTVDKGSPSVAGVRN